MWTLARAFGVKRRRRLLAARWACHERPSGAPVVHKVGSTLCTNATGCGQADSVQHHQFDYTFRLLEL